MRVLHLVQQPQRRGAEVFAFTLTAELRRQGHEVAITYLYPHDAPGALPLAEEDCVLGGDPKNPLERLIGAHPGLLAKVRQRIRTFRPDVVQVNGARSVKYGALARRLDRGDGWVLVYRNIGNPRDWLRRGVIGQAQGLFYRHAVMPALDGLVGVSKATLAGVLDVYALDIPNAAIPRAVDPAVLAPDGSSRAQVRQELSTPEDAPVVVFLGSLAPEKRLDRFFRTAKKASEAHDNLHVWVIGEGPERERAERFAEEANMSGRTRFLGLREDIARLLRASDLLLLTSDTEGIPGVILEAAFVGVPSVATNVGGVSECIRHGVTGLLAAVDDEDALARSVCELAGNASRRQELGEKAAAWIAEDFTIGSVAQRYLELYEKVRLSAK